MSNYRNVTRGRPCPVCHKPDQCSLREDGVYAVCFRVFDSTAFQLLELTSDSSGRSYAKYLLVPHAARDRQPPPVPTVDMPGDGAAKADADTLDLVYRALLDHLDHPSPEAMRKRGFQGSRAADIGYRRLGRDRIDAVAKLIAKGFEKHLPGVPGFYIRPADDKIKTPCWSLTGKGGLVVPVRDEQGRIVAALDRPDEPGEGGKYHYLSSKSRGGPGSGAPVHFPLFDGDKSVVRITEGSVKADLATHLSGVYTIGLPGVGTWSRAARAAKAVGAKTVRVAFDADAVRNQKVAKALRLLVERLLEEPGLAVELELWPIEDGKGIDDVLAAGKSPQVVQGEEAVLAAVARIAAEADRAAKSEATGKSVGPAEPIHLTEMGNALRLVRLHGGDIRYITGWDKWLLWDNSRWKDTDKFAVRRLLASVRREIRREASEADDKDQREAIWKWAEMSEQAKISNAAIDIAREFSALRVNYVELDADPHSLNVANGTLNLHDGTLRAHRREDCLTRLCPTRYDPDARCPAWEKFLGEVFAGDFELTAYVQRLLGYCLTGATTTHMLPVFWGGGGNGKGTLLNTVLRILGSDYAVTPLADFLLARQGDRHPTEIAQLHGKRLASCQESGEDRSLNEPLVKWLTGGDPLSARRMREDPWEFEPTHKVILSTNYRPRVRGGDAGIWRRLRLVPFTQQFSGAAEDTGLPGRLLGEAEGILAWLVRGCLDWHRQGERPPKAVTEATQDYREAEDVVQQFIGEKCALAPGKNESATELYRTFCNWLEGRRDRAAMSQRAFGDRLTAKGFTKDKDKDGLIRRNGLLLRPVGAAPQQPTSTSTADSGQSGQSGGSFAFIDHNARAEQVIGETAPTVRTVRTVQIPPNPNAIPHVEHRI